MVIRKIVTKKRLRVISLEATRATRPNLSAKFVT